MQNQRINNFLGFVLLLVTSAIHLVATPDAFGDAPYKGFLFLAAGVGCMVAIYLSQYADGRWGWWLGVAVCASMFVGYILSRTVGLPGLPAEPDAWFEPTGIASFVSEFAYLVLAFVVLRGNTAPRTQSLQSRSA